MTTALAFTFFQGIQNDTRAFNHCSGEAREFSNLDTITSVSGAFDNLMEEDDVAFPFTHGDGGTGADALADYARDTLGRAVRTLIVAALLVAVIVARAGWRAALAVDWKSWEGMKLKAVEIVARIQGDVEQGVVPLLKRADRRQYGQLLKRLVPSALIREALLWVMSVEYGVQVEGLREQLDRCVLLIAVEQLRGQLAGLEQAEEQLAVARLQQELGSVEDLGRIEATELPVRRLLHAQFDGARGQQRRAGGPHHRHDRQRDARDRLGLRGRLHEWPGAQAYQSKRALRVPRDLRLLVDDLSSATCSEPIGCPRRSSGSPGRQGAA